MNQPSSNIKSSTSDTFTPESAYVSIRIDLSPQPIRSNQVAKVSIPFAPISTPSPLFLFSCNDVTSPLGARVPNERVSWKGEERSSRSFRSGNSVDERRCEGNLPNKLAAVVHSQWCNCATPFFYPLETGLDW